MGTRGRVGSPRERVGAGRSAQPSLGEQRVLPGESCGSSRTCAAVLPQTTASGSCTSCRRRRRTTTSFTVAATSTGSRSKWPSSWVRVPHPCGRSPSPPCLPASLRLPSLPLLGLGTWVHSPGPCRGSPAGAESCCGHRDSRVRIGLGGAGGSSTSSLEPRPPSAWGPAWEGNASGTGQDGSCSPPGTCPGMFPWPRSMPTAARLPSWPRALGATPTRVRGLPPRLRWRCLPGVPLSLVSSGSPDRKGPRDQPGGPGEFSEVRKSQRTQPGHLGTHTER